MIQIDTESREPLVKQVCKALKQAIASGMLAPGQELPSARQLGGDLGIHWNTVSRAYRLLSESGIIFVAHGRKAYVKDRSAMQDGPTAEHIEDVTRLFREALTQARLYGMDNNAAELILQKEMSDWTSS